MNKNYPIGARIKTPRENRAQKLHLKFVEPKSTMCVFFNDSNDYLAVDSLTTSTVPNGILSSAQNERSFIVTLGPVEKFYFFVAQ